MINVTIKHEDGNGREFGYGVYVNAYVEWHDQPGIVVLYATECVPFGKNTPEALKAAERRVRAAAERIAKEEFVG